MEFDRRALLLSLIAQWAAQYQDEFANQDAKPWWLSPRKLTALVGQFDAPTKSDNDPQARCFQLGFILVFLCAIYRANQIIPQLFTRKYLNRREIAETRVNSGFSEFFCVFSLCQMIRPPSDSGRVAGSPNR